MTLTLADLDFLVTEAGAALLQRLADEDLSETNTLTLLTKLRRTYSAEQAGAALTMARLRQKATLKFGADAARMFFTPDALEQASDPLVRCYRSVGVAGRRVYDMGCGIGADSLAFAAAGAHVTGVDSDTLRVAMARYNASALGLAARFEVADIREVSPSADMIFFDPARRDEGGRRIFNVEQYQPPLSTIRRWQAAQKMIKLSPGVALEQLAGYEGAVEFISVRGDLKEAVLHLGVAMPLHRATLLTDEAAYHMDVGETVTAPLSEPRAWLAEPDPAVLRAGLVADLALMLGAYQLDETIAYLTADELPRSPWVRSWRVLDWMPLHLKRLRAYLRDQRVGRVTVKKRGVSMTPEEVLAALKLKGSESRVLVLTRCLGQHCVLICEDRVS